MIYLVTDSTAYLSREEASALGVLMVPMAFIKDGREAFQEGFVEEWQPKPGQSLAAYSTSQAQASAFSYLFDRLKAQGHQALCITISSRLSGTFANALKAAEETGECIQVIDSRTTAGAPGAVHHHLGGPVPDAEGRPGDAGRGRQPHPVL